MTIIFTLSIFASAYLLLLIQPIVSKLLLPSLGGSPAVWNTSMMFFQTLLLLGYLYAHLTGKWFGAKKQAIIHCVLLILALAWMPIVVHTGVASVQHPVHWLIGALFVSVGVPYFLLAANAPLMQSWFAHTTHKNAANPYFLYSTSNAGSLLALLGYPLLIEPWLTLSVQTKIWSLLFALFVLSVIGCAVAMHRHYATIADMEHVAPEAPPSATQRLRWITLAFAPSSLLLGVTTYITTDIASVPLLWVVPLAIYLITFILAFAPGAPMTGRALNAQIVLVPMVAMAIIFKFNFISQVLLLHLFAFFSLAMACHGTLARTKPGVQHLTEFYVCVSLGGMLGGVFNSLLAPKLFTYPIEYPLILVLCLLLRPLQGYYANPRREWQRDLGIPAGAAVIMAIALYLVNDLFTNHPDIVQTINQSAKTLFKAGNDNPFGSILRPLLAGLFYLFFMLAVAKSYMRPLRFALLITSLFIVVPSVESLVGEHAESKLVYATRNFFGINRVLEWTSKNAMFLQHGTTTQGMQSLDDKDRLKLVSYYGPLEKAYRRLSPSIANKPIAVLGLGAGTMACLGGKGQAVDFYEIDPAVFAIAANPRFFRYLHDCKASSSVVLGDGRLMLEKAKKGYGMVIIDVFSSDAIPVHLLTREAIQIYDSKLADGGAIAFNISNRHLDLQRVMGALAAELGMKAIILRNFTLDNRLALPSIWVVMSHNQSRIDEVLKSDAGWKKLEGDPSARVWTDDYSNILETLF